MEGWRNGVSCDGDCSVDTVSMRGGAKGSIGWGEGSERNDRKEEKQGE